MKTFLALVSKQETLDPDLRARVPSLADRALPFRNMPYREQAWESRLGQLALFAWDNDAETPSGRALIDIDGERAVTFSGYVTHPALPSPWDATGLARAVTLSDRVVGSLGGMFALAQVNGDDGELLVWTSASRAAPVYWIEGPDYFAVSTRALMLSFLLAKAPRPAYRLATLVPFLACGRFASDQTPFRGVQELPPNSRLSASPAGVTIRPTDDFERTCGTVRPTSGDYDVLAELLLSSVRPLGDSRVVCNLTGGKDSRLVAAALYHAGVDVTTQTNGFPESPDVLVAQRVAAALGLPHRTSPAHATGNGSDMVSVDLPARTRGVVFGSDGMLSAYENLVPPQRFSPTPVAVGGHGGEISLRDSFATGPISWETALDVLRSYYLPPPDLFVPEALGFHAAFLEDWLSTAQASGTSPTAALDLFAFRFDLGVSGIGPIVTEVGRYGVYPLMDNQVTKAGLQAHAQARLGDALVFNLLNRLAPGLIDVPFAYTRWNFEWEGSRPGDEEGWAQRAPVTAPAGTRGTFNWRHHWSRELWHVFHEQIFGDSRAVGLFELLDRKAFERWFGRRRGIVDADGTALAWSAYSASVLLSNAWLDADTAGGAEVLIPAPAPALA